MQILSMSLTGLLVIYAVYRQKQYGAARACVAGTGFFAAAFYLDSIFRLIMENAAGLAGDSLAGAVPGSGNTFLPEWITQCMGIFLAKSILCMLLAAARAAGIASAGDKWEEPQKGWQYLDGLTVGIASFSVLLGYACLKSGGENDFQTALRLLFLLTLLLTYYISLHLYQRKQYAQRLQEEARTQEREEKRYLKNVEEQYQRTRELWHDLKNHISLLNLFLQEGDYDKMADYLRIFGDDVDSLTLPVKSGNPVADALLADKAARAKKENIPMELSLCDLAELSLKPDEICSLLGNLLDNALEANREVAEGRFLSVECRKTTDFYYIKIQNPVAGPLQSGPKPGQRTAASGILQTDPEAGREKMPDLPQTSSGAGQGKTSDLLQSRKTDRRNQVGHGLGMRSIERIVHSNGGELAVDRTENRFTVVVRLPVCR